MRALVIQPDQCEQAGMVGEALRNRGFSLDVVTIQADMNRTEGTTDFPSPGEHDLVLVTGSPWSVYDEAVSSWVDPLLGYLAKMVGAEIPVLGICFGGQALSAALGGVVSRSEIAEVGWTRIESSVAPLLGPWYELHFDRFTVPEGGELLAETSVGPQAFRFGRSLGLQFHPEVDVAHLQMWFDSGDTERLQAAGIDTAVMMEDTVTNQADARRRVGELIDWYLQEIAELQT